MKLLKIFPTSINERFIAEAVDAMRHGHAVIYPTDSYYALGCDALNNGAVNEICRLKGIDPKKQSLSVVCDSISQASEYARIDNAAFHLLKEYLPGPFTFILPAATTLPKVFKGRRTVGVRIPDNAIARALAEALGNPVLSSSIILDPDSPADNGNPEAIAARFAGEAALAIDGGDIYAEPSTVVDITDSRSPEILRRGKGIFNA